MTPSDAEKLDVVAARLRDAQSLLFVTGAGISAASGIPTYRGVGGLYQDAETPDGLPIEQVLSGETFREDPGLTWRYLHQIEQASRGATCNRAHEIVAAADASFERVWVLTQNVDGFHREAGSRNVIDIHGDIHEIVCTSCPHRARLSDYRELEPLPLCPACAAPLRPEVVLFGELLPFEKVETMQRELGLGFDAVFSVGTTSVFPYIMRPIEDARRRGKLTVEINPGRTLLSHEVDVQIPLEAIEALEGIWSRLS